MQQSQVNFEFVSEENSGWEITSVSSDDVMVFEKLRPFSNGFSEPHSAKQVFSNSSCFYNVFEKIRLFPWQISVDGTM